MALLPSGKPQQGQKLTESILGSFAIDLSKPALLGVRGYFLNSMGVKEENDRGVYDDAVFVYSPTCHVAFNFNTDPSNSAYGRAVLQSGKVWTYKKGIHGLSKPAHLQYWALVQADEVTVLRDGWKQPDEGWFGINIHRGSNNSTSSLGCQTLPPSQWETFKSIVYGEMDRYKVTTIPYVLTEYQGGGHP